MELLINSVGFFAVVIAVVGFYAAILILAWQRLSQIRTHIRDCRTPTASLGLKFDIQERAR